MWDLILFFTIFFYNGMKVKSFELEEENAWMEQWNFVDSLL